MQNHKKHPPRQAVLEEKASRTPFRAHAHLLPTLFDRLCDDAPQRQTETPADYAVTRKQMADIVQRDLAYLLNTANMEDLINRHTHEAAAASTINFGMPSLSGSYLSTRKWADIEQLIHRAITDFEPRLVSHSLQITPLHKDHTASQYNVLLFEIRGLIRMDPYPMAFLVQSAVDLETNRLSVVSSSGR